MKVRLRFQKENIGAVAIAMVFAAALYAAIGFSPVALVAFGALYCLIQGFRIEVCGSLAPAVAIPMFFGSAAFTAYLIQYLLLDAELREKTSGEKMMLNVICCLSVFLLVQAATGIAGLSCVISFLSLTLLAWVDYFVYLFRGNEFIFSDLRSIQTGLSVAGNYEFVLDDRAGYALLASVLYIALARRVKITFKMRVPAAILCLSLAALGVVAVGQRTADVVTETWEQKGSYRNGFILNFALSVRDSFVAEPDGYSAEAVAALEARYADGAGDGDDGDVGIARTDGAHGDEKTINAGSAGDARTDGAYGDEKTINAGADDAHGDEKAINMGDAGEYAAPLPGREAVGADVGGGAPGGKRPTIIIVMNESYADLHVVGDFSTDIDVTPFYDSLSDNIVKGYALSSVYGAKTPNSEWEFLTGNSMAFLPSGSVVYQQYISSEPTSLVSNLKNEGYTCVAMHPYYETGWSRDLVYPDLGFDEMHFIDDFDQDRVLREYITDQELYEKIIDRYESRSVSEDLFIMSISMQNHGGYTEKYANFSEEARLLTRNFPDVNQYLSLLHESDKALSYLISYFERVDEPVEIVFFGDHQPSLSSSFYPMLNGKGLSGLYKQELEALYTVPFFIWTNYESETRSVGITSLNFLSTMVLERAGLPLPPYNRFLRDFSERIPAINARGYYSISQGRYLDVSEASGEDARWLSDYEILQYNGMFGKKEKSELFFPYLRGD